MRIAHLTIALLLSACSNSAPDPAAGPQARQKTREFVMRGATLGGPCQVARDFEAAGSTFKKHDVVRGVDLYSFSKGRARISLIYCQSGVLCEQNVTTRFGTESEANASCEAQRTDLLSRLGTPSLDAQGDVGSLPSVARELFDPQIIHPTIWELSESEFTLDCPTSPNGQGQWSVTLSHGFDPRVVEYAQGDGSTLVVPSHDCGSAR